MKLLLFVSIAFISTSVNAQSRTDSLKIINEMSKLYALTLTEPEQDSMLDDLKEYRAIYQNMHRQSMPNNLSFPFAFRPFPPGVKIPSNQKLINWNIPSDVRLPVDRNELAWYSIPQLASLLKNKRISSVELTRFFLDRLKKYNDTLHCVISFTEDLALIQARKADEEIANGNYKGPLHGIPYGIKDLFAVKGTKTTWGSRPFKDQLVDEDAFVYRQLTNAGAVLCAKLSLGALAFNDLWFGGRTNNPWNLRQGSSGSSAGSAAATAAGLLPFAIGTETWGSIVSPSHRCGVTGLRPTFGSISRSGGMVLSWTLDKAGPICRSAEDAAIVFYHIKGADDKDPSSIERAFNYNPSGNIRSLRVAIAINYFRQLPKDSHQWKAVEDLKKLGVKIIEANFPDSTAYPADIMNPIISAESAAAFDELTRSNRDSLIERQDKNFWPNIFRTARFIPAVEYINANRLRTNLIDTIHRFMSNYDVVIVPSFSGNQTAITNLTGHPVVVLPIGFAQSGNPNSISFLGNYFGEDKILALAKAYQTATDHNKIHPPFFK